MKKFLILIAILLLCGGSIGDYFYFGNSAIASIPEGQAGEMAEAQSIENLLYVELSPLLLPIVDHNGVSQVVSLVVSLEVNSEESRLMVEKLSPRLTDAYIHDLYGVLNYKAALQGGVVQVSEVKRRLNMITTKVIGEDVINDVLLQVVSQRRV